MDMLAYFLGRLAGGGGAGSGRSPIEYTKVEYGENDTIKLYDEDNNEHVLQCAYDDNGKLISITFEDGETISMNYTDDVINSVGNIEIDVANAPAVNVGGEQTIVVDVSNSTIGDDGILDFGGMVE